jgi:quercetin dioxygenase-like cupin family protein
VKPDYVPDHVPGSEPDPRELARLVAAWRTHAEVTRGIAALERELADSREPFVGAPLPETLVRAALPAGVASAWLFVLRAKTRNPAHVHPNSTQSTTVLAGGGLAWIAGRRIELEPFDARRAAETILVIPRGVAHAFEPGDAGLVVLSFHSVPPEDLVELEVESAKRRKYVGDQGA